MMDGSKLALSKQTTRMSGQLAEGFAYVWKNPVLRNTLALAAVIGTFTYEFPVVLPLYASRTFHSGAGTYALFMAMMSIGAVIGGVMTAGSRRLTQPAVAMAAIIFGASIIVAAAAPSSVAAAALLVGVGAASILFVATANSILQLHARPDMRGRVMALWSVAFLGTTPIGGPIIGWVSDAGGPRMALLVGGAAAAVAGAAGLIYARRTVTAESGTRETT
jgi:MFS family permease